MQGINFGILIVAFIIGGIGSMMGFYDMQLFAIFLGLVAIVIEIDGAGTDE